MLRKRTKTFSITSGKGGVGKSSVVANLAYSLAKKGNKVLIFDGDLGMANIDIMFGTRAKSHVLDLLRDDCSIDDVLTRLDQNLYLIPGGTGIPELQQLNSYERKMIIDQLSDLEGIFDYLLIDTSPGIDENVRLLNSAASEVLIVLTPEPASLTDAYALIKVLYTMQNEKDFKIICNQVNSEKEATRLYEMLQKVCDQFLDVSLEYMGCVKKDLALAQATRNQKLVLQSAPESESATQLNELARKLSGYGRLGDLKGSMQFFFQAPEV
jgi:flagellar biosynthesis protein FlhG